MDVRSLFADIKRPELWLWGLALVAMVIHVFPGARWFYGAHVVAGDLEPAMLAWQNIQWHHVATLLCFGIPLCLMPLLGIHRQGLSLFQPGDWRWGLRWTLLSAVTVTLPTWISSSDPAFLREYPLTLHAFDSPLLLTLFFGSYLLYYIGWEAFFRGFLGFGLTGVGYSPFLALMVQVSLSTIIHIGKPPMELVSAIPGGIFMGILAYRSGSLLWPLLFHFYVGIINTLFCWMHL